MGFSSKAGKDLEIAENSFSVLRLSKVDDQLLPPNLTPHVQVSSRFLPMIETTRDEVSRCWEVSQPANSDVLSYRFALVSKDSSDVHFQEDPNHVLHPVEDKASFVIRLGDRTHNFQVDIQQKIANDAKAPENHHSTRISDVNRSVSIKDLVLLGSSEAQTDQAAAASAEKSAENRAAPLSVQSRSIGTDPLTTRYEDHQGLYVNRSVGNSPKPFRISSDISMLDGNPGVENEVPEDMPEATGAVAAAAVSERMLLPKERRQLAIVLVGLPARGKTFTAVKLTRYLRWLGHDTKHFNVGKYRRLKHGCTQTADFFRGDNQEGVDARNEVAILAMEDMLSWMEAGGQIGVFDATNSTKERRNMILRMAEGKCKVIFLETICKDESIIERNINLKIQQSPDYADQTDYEAALADFKARLQNYEKAYESVDEGSYIKMIDTVTGQGGQIQVNGISGYLPGRIVFFLVNTHITPRPIFLTRHGESMYNLSGQIGGDAGLSNAGEEYAAKLANFLGEKLKLESTASVWTSTLQRTILTAEHIVRFPKVQWRALDEINAGICDGMTYEEIRKKMPDEFQARKLDKLRYRYPRGESYLDVIQRLEPVIIELERQRAPVVVIAHQAVLRSLYAYFADKPLKEIPHIEVPLHTVIEIQMGVTGIQEKRYKLMEVI